MRKYSKVLAAAALLAGSLYGVSSADAALIIDVRTAANTKSAAVTAVNDVVTLNIYGIVTGNDATSNEGMQIASGSMISGSGGLLGTISAVTFNPTFNGTSSTAGAAFDAGGDGDTDRGAVDGGTTANYITFRSNSMTTGGTAVTYGGAAGNEYFLGSVTFTVTALSSSTTVNWRPRLTAGGLAVNNGATWQQDGAGTTQAGASAWDPNTSPYRIGTAVTITGGSANFIIDPATLTLATLQGAASVSGDVTVTNNGTVAGSSTLSLSGGAPLSIDNTATGSVNPTSSVNRTITLATGSYASGSQTVEITNDTPSDSTTVNYNVGRATAANNGNGTFGSNALQGTSTGAGLSSRVVNGPENSNAEVTGMNAGSAVSMNWRLADATDLAPLFSDVVFIDALGADQTYDLKIYYADDYNGIENELFLGRRNNDGTYNAAGGINVNTTDVVIDGISYGGYVWATALNGDGTFAVIPEPTSLALLGLGAAGLLARRKKA